MRTQAKTKKAAAVTAARKNELCHQSYRKVIPLSSLKIQIGEILLCLQRPLNQNERRICWQAFERTLQEFYQIEGIR